MFRGHLSTQRVSQKEFEMHTAINHNDAFINWTIPFKLMYCNCGNSTSKCDITEVRLTYYILLYNIPLLCNVCSRFSGRMKKYMIFPLLIINKPQSSLHSDTCLGSEFAPWWFSALYYYLSYLVQRKQLRFVLITKIMSHTNPDYQQGYRALIDAENYIKKGCEIIQREASRVRLEQESIDAMSKKLDQVHFSSIV